MRRIQKTHPKFSAVNSWIPILEFWIPNPKIQAQNVFYKAKCTENCSPSCLAHQNTSHDSLKSFKASEVRLCAQIPHNLHKTEISMQRQKFRVYMRNIAIEMWKKHYTPFICKSSEKYNGCAIFVPKLPLFPSKSPFSYLFRTQIFMIRCGKNPDFAIISQITAIELGSKNEIC